MKSSRQREVGKCGQPETAYPIRARAEGGDAYPFEEPPCNEGECEKPEDDGIRHSERRIGWDCLQAANEDVRVDEAVKGDKDCEENDEDHFSIHSDCCGECWAGFTLARFAGGV